MDYPRLTELIHPFETEEEAPRVLAQKQQNELIAIWHSEPILQQVSKDDKARGLDICYNEMPETVKTLSSQNKCRSGLTKDQHMAPAAADARRKVVDKYVELGNALKAYECLHGTAWATPRRQVQAWVKAYNANKESNATQAPSAATPSLSAGGEMLPSRRVTPSVASFFDRAYKNAYQISDQVARNSYRLVVNKVGCGFDYPTPKGGEMVDVVYMLHNPLMQDVSLNEQGDVSLTFRRLEAAWTSLGVDPQAAQIMMTELNPIIAQGMNSNLPKYDSVCQASMEAALSVTPRVLVVFGEFNARRWINEAAMLQSVVSIAPVADPATDRVHWRLTLVSGARSAFTVRRILAAGSTWKSYTLRSQRRTASW